MPVLDLSVVIHQKLATSDLADPRDVANALIDDGDILPEEYAVVLRQTLPHFVREIIRSERSGRDGHRSGDIPARTASRPVRSGHANRSARWEASSVYGMRIFTGTQWKLLGDCTWRDVASVAQEYAKRETENGRMRRRYEAILGLRAEFPRVRSLKAVPADRLSEILHGDEVTLARILEAQRLRGVA